MKRFDELILIRGAGDLGSGVAYRLVKAGFPVIMTELPAPMLVRTTVSFGTCVLNRTVIISGIMAHRATLDSAPHYLDQDMIPVIADPTRETIDMLAPSVIVDARVAKHNIDTTIDDAPLVVALGPGFIAGVDCHAVIETNRGHNLGRVIWRGSAEPNTGVPGSIGGKTNDRVLRAPADGIVSQIALVGQRVTANQIVARVDDMAVIAPFDGVLRGLIDFDVHVTKGMKIGDLDPRAEREYCFTISDKSLAIGGGVIEAVMSKVLLS